MIAVIGNGLVAKQVISIVKPNMVFTSSNIDELNNTKWETIYCAAPSGNRVWVQENPYIDKSNIWKIIHKCADTKFNRFVLFSTGDTQVKPNSAYGHNRLVLENWVRELPSSSIIRLPSLIHNKITKNVLYDIKNNCWVDKINPQNELQWFDLTHLHAWIYTEHREVNVCSEPIYTQDIIRMFAPNIISKLDYTSTGDKYNLSPYSYNRTEIFSSIKEYLK